jgi:hypothetical protein
MTARTSAPGLRALVIALHAWLIGVALTLFSDEAAAEPLTLQLSIRSDDRSGAQRVLRATHGDKLAIEWSTDKTVVVHIHPYDIEQKVEPGTPSRSEFTARISGRFPIEAHFASTSKGKVVAYLEVLPR